MFISSNEISRKNCLYSFQKSLQKESCRLAVTTAVALFAIGLTLLSLYCLLNPTGELASALGSVGTFSLLSAAGVILLVDSILFLYCRNRAKKEEHHEEIEIDSIDSFKELFIKNALERLREKQPDKSTPNLKLSHKEEKLLKTALKKGKGVEWQHEGGEKIVFKIKGIERVIFKIHADQKKWNVRNSTEKYIKTQESARKICNNLEDPFYLIKIPSAKMIYVQDQSIYVIVEENINKGNDKFKIGDFDFQKGLYQWGLEVSELQPYFHELFRQLALFICRMNFRDVKFDNTLANVFGVVNLIDLDRRGAVGGLTCGQAGKAKMEGIQLFEQRQGNGLLNYLPSEWLDEFVDLVKKELSSKKVSLLEERLSSIRKRVAKREKKRSEYAQFLKKREITNCRDQIKYDDTLLESIQDEKTKLIVETLLAQINDQLNENNNPDLLTGRKLVIDISMRGLESIWRTIKKGQQFTQWGSNGRTGQSFVSNIPPALDFLKSNELIQREKFNPKQSKQTVTVFC